MPLDARQLEQCESSRWDFSDLSALFLNCTLKRSPELSHTEGLIDISRAIMEKNGISVEVLRPVDLEIAYAPRTVVYRPSSALEAARRAAGHRRSI